MIASQMRQVLLHLAWRLMAKPTPEQWAELAAELRNAADQADVQALVGGVADRLATLPTERPPMADCGAPEAPRPSLSLADGPLDHGRDTRDGYLP